MSNKNPSIVTLRLGIIRRWFKNKVVSYRCRKAVKGYTDISTVPPQTLRDALGNIDLEMYRCILVCDALLTIGQYFGRSHLDFKATKIFMQWDNGTMTDVKQLTFISNLMESKSINRDVYNWLVETGDVTSAMVNWYLSDDEKRETFRVLLDTTQPTLRQVD